MYYTHETRIDGFGAQYQTIITTILFCQYKKINYVYSPLKMVEHNYDNNSNYTNNLESLMNLKNNVVNITTTTNGVELKFGMTVLPFFDANIDYLCNSETMKYIKKCFWMNKERNYFKNTKINIAVHIRRENIADRGQCGERGNTPNTYYLNLMKKIRNQYDNNSQILFHIYSQGNSINFQEFNVADDVILHLNDDITTTFIGMVAANILIISPSSFSYVAALISDGIIYYKNFWHKPKKEWIICE
jgi:hypothetical protein